MKSKSKISIRIGQLLGDASSLFDQLNYEQAEALTQKAVALAVEHQLKSEEMDSLEYLGFLHLKELGDLETARNAFKRCIEILKEQAAPSANKMAGFYYRIGLTYYHAKPRLLIANHLQALDLIGEDRSDAVSLSRIFSDLGLAYQTLNEFESAESSYLESINIQREANPESENEIPWMHHLADMHRFYLKNDKKLKANTFKERYDLALEEYQKQYLSKPNSGSDIKGQ